MSYTVAQRIKHTADQVEKLAPQVASAALFAHNNPSDQHGQQHLSLVKDEWTAKVKQLTTAVDEVTDSQDLLVASGKICNIKLLLFFHLCHFGKNCFETIYYFQR